MKGSNLTILITQVLAGIMGVVSGYGSQCVTFNIEEQVGPFSIVTEYQTLWYITTILTWIAGLATLVFVWALLTRKPWYYIATITTAVVGAITGYIPWYLIVQNGGGTPSNIRAYLYTALIVLMLIPLFKKGIDTRINESEGSKAISDATSQDVGVSAVLTTMGLITMVLPALVSSSHANVGWTMYGLTFSQYAVIFFYTGLTIALMGIGNFLLRRVGSSRPISVRN